MRSRRPRVLIVDDEDNIVLALHRVLYQDNPRYDVLLARSAEIAQQILLDVPVDVLVTDVHLPEMSGMDLLCWAAIETPTTRVMVMTAFDISGIKDRAHAFGCLRLMRKPFDVHEMRGAILRALDRRDGFAGNLADLSAIDVIQMLCIGRKTVSLRLSEGQRSGVILIENGEIVHAIWEQYIGEDAFFQMMTVVNGLFHTSPLPPDIERTIRGDWQYLLMEGIRRLDELAAGIIPDDQPRPSMRYAPIVSSMSQAPDAGGMGALFSIPPPPRMPSAQGAPAPQAAAAAPARPPPAGQPPPPQAAAAAPAAAPANAAAGADVSRLIDQGFSSLRSGNRDEARKFWEEALKLDPSNRMIELNIRKLDAKNLRDQR
jgi:CheY-like chemotaxis protein